MASGCEIIQWPSGICSEKGFWICAAYKMLCWCVCVWLTENQVHGLDKEEAEFLDFVHDRQQEVEKERQLEEMSALQDLHVFFGCVSSYCSCLSFGGT